AQRSAPAFGTAVEPVWDETSGVEQVGLRATVAADSEPPAPSAPRVPSSTVALTPTGLGQAMKIAGPMKITPARTSDAPPSSATPPRTGPTGTIAIEAPTSSASAPAQSLSSPTDGRARSIAWAAVIAVLVIALVGILVTRR